MSLRSMFASVAQTYDLLNCVLTWGFDKVWRRSCAIECASGSLVLDLCCGTSDLALHISEHVASKVNVLGLDFNKTMLHMAINKKAKAESRRINSGHDRVRVNPYNLSFILADAAHLPLRDGCVDRIGMSFSLRNLIYRNPLAKIYLKEVLRTLRSGGKFVCVETSQPRQRLLRFLFHLYLRKVVPLVGGLVSGRKSAYRYLGMSAINFPPREEVTKTLLSAGFREVSFKPMTLGVVGIHIGIK